MRKVIKLAHYIEFKNISRLFPGVKALDDISFRAEGGKVTALMGENGAGKSTLLKIMSGDIQASEGTFELDGTVCNFPSPHDAIVNGVSIIYQERQLIPSMSVMENIFAGSLPRRKSGLIDRKTLRKNAQAVIDRFKLPIDPTIPVARLSVAYQQMVEIMKAYCRESVVIAFDAVSYTHLDVYKRQDCRRIAQIRRPHRKHLQEKAAHQHACCRKRRGTAPCAAKADEP